MAAPVGNLLRKLIDSIHRERDLLIVKHLKQIYIEFNEALPFLHDAEWMREVQEEEPEPKRQIHKKIGKWVSRVSTLAVEVDDIITSYDSHVMNMKTGSLYTKFLYLYFFTTNENSATAKLRKFCSNGDHFTNSQFYGHNHGYVLLEKDSSDSAIDELLYVAKSATNWAKNLLAIDLLELLGRFAEKTSKEIKFLKQEALDLKLIKSTIVPNQYYSRNLVQNKSAPVGRHNEVNQLESWLLMDEGTSDSDPIMIIGAAGIGKTTVAKAVYERFSHQFDCHAWVFVSPSPNTKVLLRDMLKGVLKSISMMLPSNLNSMDVSFLKKIIQKHLVGKKFLLVLDDVQAPDVFENVKEALPQDCRAKIILTSRTNFPFYRYVLPLNQLNCEDASTLLQICASTEEASILLQNSALQSEASEILKRCEGHPLAIATIGGLLSTKQQEAKQWTKFRDKLMEAHFIQLCYADMHPVLKSCFLYAASFPLNFEIPCKRLQRLWLAEGFVQEDTDKTMEDAIKLNLNELIQRNMIQVDRIGIDGEIETCRVLKPMREFALKRSEQDRFSTSVDSTSISIERPHRLFLSTASTGIDKLNVSGLYSLISFNRDNPQSLILTKISKSRFHMLRVLELNWLPGENLPDAVLGQLGLLRYLGLRGTRLKKLPKSLTKLQRLQILDIRDTFVRDLPTDLERLKLLRHLLLGGSFGDKVVNLEVEIENFSSLQTLAGVKLTERIVKGLYHLSQLRKLSVGEVKSFFAEDLFKSINQMKLLHSLTMKFAREEEVHLGSCNALDNLAKLRIGGRIMNLLDWVTKLYSLKYLFLWDSMLEKDPLSSLQHLPSLVLLSLCNAYDGEEIKFGTGGFKKLKKLSILHCKGLEKWTEIEDGSMQKLQILTIAYCPKLSTFPKGLEKLTCLQVLQVSHMPEHFINEARNMKSVLSPKFSILVRETTRLSSLVNDTQATKMSLMPNPAH